ncbi:MAG: hypothetical protein SFT68_02990 [Rickettsiaceae bacterium]|nr:hypothetical protein [Rickettsiaceae bacterium]
MSDQDEKNELVDIDFTQFHEAQNEAAKIERKMNLYEMNQLEGAQFKAQKAAQKRAQEQQQKQVGTKITLDPARKAARKVFDSIKNAFNKKSMDISAPMGNPHLGNGATTVPKYPPQDLGGR